MVSTHAWKAPNSSLPTMSAANSSASVTGISGTGGGLFSGLGSGGTSTAAAAATTTTTTPSPSFKPFIGSHSGGGMNNGTMEPKSGHLDPSSRSSFPRPSSISAAGQAADFESLLASSSSMLSSLGRSGIGGGREGTRPVLSSAYVSSGDGYGGTASLGQALGAKSLLELGIASRTMAGGGSRDGSDQSKAMSTTTYEAEASVHRLLARDGLGFDSAKFGRSARELEMRTSASAPPAPRTRSSFDMEGPANGGTGGGGNQPAPLLALAAGPTSSVGQDSSSLAALGNLAGSSVQEIVDAQNEHVVRAVLRSAQKWTDDQARKWTSAWLKEDWDAERDVILGRGALGGRFLVGSVSRTSRENGAMGGAVARIPLLEGGSLQAAQPSSDIIPSPQTMPSSAEPLIKSHREAIEKYLKTPQSGSGHGIPNPASNALELIVSLQKGIDDSFQSNTMNAENMEAYSNALLLFKSIVISSLNLNRSLSSSPSGSSSSNAKTADMALGVMGACHFFTHKFRSQVIEVAQKAAFAGLTNMGAVNRRTDPLLTGMAQDLNTFASIKAGVEVVQGRGGVWPRLFYCLRSGDAVAANAIIKNFGTITNSSEDLSSVDPLVAEVVSQLAQLQQEQETIFGSRSNGSTDGGHGDHNRHQQASLLLFPSMAMMQARQAVSDLYDQYKARIPSISNPEPFLMYRTACLALLGGSESLSEVPTLASSGLIETVEDYLYASLWHAFSCVDKPLSGGSLSIGNRAQKMAEAVSRLGGVIQQWGPSHFEPDDEGGIHGSAVSAVSLVANGGVERRLPHQMSRSGGWAFTLPLLASQQYATALAYLAEAGGGLGLLQATHIGISMNAAGMPISDLRLDESLSPNSSNILYPMLVTSYSASLQGADTPAALDYIMLLKEKGHLVRLQVQRLLLETRRFDVLAGKIEVDGSRSTSALDSHFSRPEVSSILGDTAADAMRAGRAADAADLLILSGKYVSLFNLMNRELASSLVSFDKENFEKRKFWFNAASRFHASHLTEGKRYVQDSLEAERSMSLGNTFQLLMNLMVFFDRCNQQQWEGACVLVDSLDLLPKNESEMTAKVESFSTLDTCVRQVFHHVVLAAMEAICHQFRIWKLGGAGSSIDQQSVINQNLNGLSTQAKLLVIFSRLINLPTSGHSDTYLRISQMEKNMM